MPKKLIFNIEELRREIAKIIANEVKSYTSTKELAKE